MIMDKIFLKLILMKTFGGVEALLKCGPGNGTVNPSGG